MATEHFDGGSVDPVMRIDLSDLGSWFVEPFFQALVARVPQPERAEARAIVQAAADELLGRVRDLEVDGQATTHVRLAAYAVAAYRWLQRHPSDTDPLEAVRSAVVDPFGEWMADATGRALDAAEDPFPTMVESCKRQEEDFFGRGFAFERVEDTDERYLARAHRCVYHDTSARLGAPELTGAVWCEWDKAWMSAVDPERHGVRASRPVTIGYGCDHCDFGFDRTPRRPR